jgi:FkbM family methyltransferase
MAKGNYYGQFEPPVDQILHQRYFPNPAPGRLFVECGAFDGETECSCKFFEETQGWRGINIEPLPPIFARLLRNRPHSVNIQAALAAQDGWADFTGIDHPDFGEYCTNGSLGHLPEHARLIDEAAWQRRQYRVRTICWTTLLAEYRINQIDLLVLDVEGTELDVIRGMVGAPVLPRVFCVEHGHLGVPAVRAELEPLGYRYDGSEAVNSFFLRQE